MGDLPRNAKIHISSVILTGIAIFAWQLRLASFDPPWMLLLLAILASTTQVLRNYGSTQRSSLSISWVVFGFTLLHEGTSEALLIILLAHLAEWVWHRIPWYIQAYNVGTYAISTLIAGLIYELLLNQTSTIPAFEVIAILAAVVSFTIINHLLVGTVILFARGQNFSESGVFSTLTLVIDTTLLSLGAAASLLWDANKIAALIPIIPLYLIHSALKLPALERETKLDPKTGLFNARYFNEILERELERANRYDRGLTVVMADMDLLRNVNNNYGHIAGDEVLVAIANIFQESFRGYDVVARFGGEEFSILIPETTPEQVIHRIDDVRVNIAEYEFEISTSPTPIHVTMSFGIAGRVSMDQSANDIIHNADVALYQAKSQGRNRAILFSGDGFEDASEPIKRQSETYAAAHSTIQKAKAADHETPRKESSMKAPPFEEAKREELPAHTALLPKPEWIVNTFILCVTLLAWILISLSIKAAPDVDWWGLTLFCGLVLITEWFAVEIYDENTSVSTSAAPYVAGVLLFGPTGVGILSILIALSAMIHHRKAIKRLIFNISNQMIGGLGAISILWLLEGLLDPLSGLVQITICILASLVLYTINTILITTAIHLDTGQPFLEIWRERFRWLVPFYAAFGVVAYLFMMAFRNGGLLGAISVLAPLLMLRFSQMQFIERTRGVVSQLRENNVELRKQKNEITTLNEELLQTLAGVSDLRDPYVVGHSQHVSRYAVLVAEEMGLEEHAVERLRKAGLLHDIGKLGISEAILQKPGKLNEQEYELIKSHVILGTNFLSACHSMRDLMPLIHHHHEHYNGRGYPDGLKGQDIPLEARILHLADAVDAMASDRPYHHAMEPRAILEEVLSLAGEQFDPAVVQAFVRLIEREGQGIIINSAVKVESKLSINSKIVSDPTFSFADINRPPWQAPNYY